MNRDPIARDVEAIGVEEDVARIAPPKEFRWYIREVRRADRRMMGESHE